MSREIDNDEDLSVSKQFIKQFNPFEYSEVSPREVGVPHDEWRPNQLSALEYAGDKFFEGSGNPIFLEMPTGSGKSAIPTAFGNDNPVIVFVESHALLDQYVNVYGFKGIKGMASYPCILSDKVETFQKRYGHVPTAADCHYQKMSDCPVSDNCPYLVARAEALASNRMVCTYAFGILSRLVRQRGGVGFWDEAHLTANIITSLSEISFSQEFFTNFGLPQPPLPFRAGIMTSKEKYIFLNFLNACSKSLENPPSSLLYEELTDWISAYERVHKLFLFIQESEDVYFNYDATGHEFSYRIGSKVIKKRVPRLIIKPLTAAINVPKLIGERQQTILMSATIGNASPLAKELGFEKFDFVTYPHPIPKQYRPIYDLQYERMTWTNINRSPNVQRLQAFRIANWIESLPKDWRGIILTSSYAKREALIAGLKQTSISNRLFQFDEASVGNRINQFHKDSEPGKIAVDISHSWGHGVSFDWDKARFIVVASVPFGELQDPFQAARREKVEGADDFAWWHAYNAVPQICGRVSRGEVQQNGEPLLNVSLLADGSAMTKAALSYYPKWFKESIIPFQ